MLGRVLDTINSALDIRYRGNGYYQMGKCVVSDDVHLLRFIAKWMEDSLLGPVEGFPVFLAKGGVHSSESFLVGAYDQITHNFSLIDEEESYYRIKLIAKNGFIPATVVIYKEGWPTMKYFRPYRSSTIINVPKKQSSQTLLFPMMKEISYAEHMKVVKAEYCAIRNMGVPVAKGFTGGLSHFDETK